MREIETNRQKYTETVTNSLRKMDRNEGDRDKQADK